MRRIRGLGLERVVKLLHQSRQSGPPPGRSSPPSPPLPPYGPASCGRPPPGAVWCSGPFFGLAYGLIAAHGARAVLVDFDRAGVNHQPFKIGVNRGHRIRRPAVEPICRFSASVRAVCGGVPAPVIRGQVAPRAASAAYVRGAMGRCHCFWIFSGGWRRRRWGCAVVARYIKPSDWKAAGVRAGLTGSGRRRHNWVGNAARFRGCPAGSVGRGQPYR